MKTRAVLFGIPGSQGLPSNVGIGGKKATMFKLEVSKSALKTNTQ